MATTTLSCNSLSYRLPDGVPASSTTPLLDKLRWIADPSHLRWLGKKLLSNVSFSISAGTMTALMGPSGAGKSTLLDVLAGRKIEGTIYGEMVNNVKTKCYVMQDDVHMGVLTVYETLQYASRLRNPASFTPEQHEDRIHYMLNMLGLEHVKNSKVGDAFTKGISGGQLKRLSIGVEAITLPSLIFLDEPTSGLDSSIALEVISCVQRLVIEGGRTVICTIHQPSAACFALFDNLLLLSEGRVVYSGRASKAKPYFEEMGYIDADGEKANAADFICQVAGGMMCGGSADPNVSFGESHVKSPRDLERLFKESPAYQTMQRALSHSTTSRMSEHEEILSVDKKEQRHTSIIQFYTLLSRGLLVNKRNVAYRNAQIVKNIIVGLLAGVIFYQQGAMDGVVWLGDLPTPAGYSVVSILYFAILYAITGNLQAIPMMFNLKVIFLRERAAGAYSTAPYWAANSLVHLPLLIATHAFFVNLTYWLVGLPTDITTLAYMFLLTLLVNLIAFFFSQFLAALCSSSQVALALFPILFMFLSNFAGFTIQLDNVQSFWVWAPYVSFPRWAYEGLVYVTFTQKKPEAYEILLEYFSFSGWNPIYSVYILLPYMLLVNLMVLWALQPPKSRIRRYASKSMDPRLNRVSRSSSRASSMAMGMDSFANAKSSSIANSKSSSYKAPLLSEQYPPISEDTEASPEDILLPPSSLDSESIDLPSGNPKNRKGSWSVDDFKRNSMGIDMGAHTNNGLNVTFKNLRYRVNAPKNENASNDGFLTILNETEGRAENGEMVALMGASGAGKSTLLDILAGRKTLRKGLATLTGTLLFNGRPRTRPLMRRSAYVTQDNVHLSSLTVRQTLGFAAALRMENSTMESREERILMVAKMLGIDKILDSRVGGTIIRGISGGQLKRLSIAVEIIHLPSLIFLDEPTTGLDSSIAHEVMSAVRNLANFNRTVICTIHQPPPATFALFDKLLLLAHGRTCYFGPVSTCTSYFEKFGYHYDSTATGANPAEFAVAVAGAFVEPKKFGHELCELYTASEERREFSSNFDTRAKEDQGLSRDNEFVSTYPSSLGEQCLTLAKRQIMKTMQDKKPLTAGIMRHIVVALFYGSIYSNLGQEQKLERMSLCFFTLMFVVMGHQQNIPLIFEERLLFYRERGAKIYGNFSYWLTGGVSVVPLTVVMVAIFCGVMYKMTGFRNEWSAFFFFFLIAAITSLNGLFYCQLLAVLSPSQQAAITLFPATLFFFISFTGYIIQIPALPEWLSKVPDVSFLRWGFQALVINEFEDNTLVFPPTLLMTTEQQFDIFVTAYGFQGYTKWQSLQWLLVNAGVFRVATFLGLRYVRYENR